MVRNSEKYTLILKKPKAKNKMPIKGTLVFMEED